MKYEHYVRYTTTITTKMKQIQGGNKKKINLFIQLKGNARKKTSQQSTINYKLIAVYFLYSTAEKTKQQNSYGKN